MPPVIPPLSPWPASLSLPKSQPQVFILLLSGLYVDYLSSLSHPQVTAAPLLSCFPFHLFSWTFSKSCATHLLLFPLITWTRLDSTLLSDLLAVQKLQKTLFSTGLFSVACGLPDLPQQHLFLPPTSPVAHSLSLHILKTLLTAMGNGQGLLSAGGSCGDSRPSWLQGHGHPVCVGPGEREPSQERLILPPTRRVGSDGLPGGTMMLRMCSSAKALHPSCPLRCRARSRLSEDQPGQVLVSAPAGPVQLQGPGNQTGLDNDHYYF